MAFSKFTLKSVKQELGIQVIEDQHLFAGCSPRVKISDLAEVDGSKDALPEILDRQTVLTRLHHHLDTLQQFRIRSLALFGSVARNEATATSDLDFLVELEAPATFDRYMDLKFFLEDLFKRPVDLVTKRSLKPQISQAVLEEAIYVT